MLVLCTSISRIRSAIIIMACTFLAPVLSFAEDISIQIDIPGSLEEKCYDIEVSRIDRLTITGNISAADIITLQSGVLSSAKILDISGVSLVETDISYAKSSNCTFCIGKPRIEHYTSDWLGSTINHRIEYTYDLKYAFQRCTFEEVILPEMLPGVGENMFYNSTNLKSVTINNQAEYVGPYAFYYCKNLEKVELSQFVTKVDSCAFQDCNALEIPDVSHVKHFGNKAFYNCISNGPIDLSNAEIIKNGAFGKTDITKIHFGEHLLEIGADAFTSTTLSEVEMPCSPEMMYLTSFNLNSPWWSKNLEVIDHIRYFRHFAWLWEAAESVTIREGVRTIGAKLNGTGGNIGTINLPSTLERIGPYGLACRKATVPEIPTSVKYIGPYAFSSCILTSIVIPETIKEINPYAFYDSGLSSVTLPSGLKKIGESAFAACNIGDIELPESIEYIGAKAFSGSDNIFFEKLPENIKYIGEGAINSTSLITLTIPEGIETAKSFALKCPNLNSVIFKARNLDCDNFIEAPKLKKFRIGASVRHLHAPIRGLSNVRIEFDDRMEPIILGDYCFRGAEQCTIINMPEDIDSIGKYAFTYAEFEDLNINLKKAKGIGEWAFLGSKIGLDLDMPSVIYIGENAFYNASTKPNTLNIPIVEYIGATAFYGIQNIGDKITIPEVTKFIGGGAFYTTDATEVNFNAIAAFCEGMPLPSDTQTLNIGPEVTVIPQDMCSGINRLTKLKTINFLSGKSRTAEPELSIGDNAFTDCYNLTMPVLPSRLVSIGKEAFSGVNSFGLIVPENVRYIGSNAFTIQSNTDDIYFLSKTVPEFEMPIFSFATGGGLKRIYVPEEGLESYKNTQGWPSPITYPMPEIILPSEYEASAGFNFQIPFELTQYAPDVNSLVWESSDESIVYPETSNNWLMAKAPGKAIVYASMPSGPARTVACEVTVKMPDAIDIVMPNNISINVENKKLVISGKESIPVKICNLAGTVIFNGCIPASIDLNTGIYIVLVGSQSHKIAIK